MPSLNKVTLIGHVGREPEMRYTPNGSAVANFTVATNSYYTNKTSGEKEETTEWHNVIVWQKLAENCNQYLTKGQLVYVEGRLQTRSWEDDQGGKRQKTEIVANSVLFLTKGTGGGAEGAPAASRAAPAEEQEEIDPEDLPF